MSALHVRLREQEKACREFERESAALRLDLGLRVPRRFLDVRVRLLEVLLERTGGNLMTEGYRTTLSELKRSVALRRSLTVVASTHA